MGKGTLRITNTSRGENIYFLEGERECQIFKITIFLKGKKCFVLFHLRPSFFNETRQVPRHSTERLNR